MHSADPSISAPSDAPGIAPDQAWRMGLRLLDVRRAQVFAQADQIAAGADWRDPALVDSWAAQLPKHLPVAVYCVHGHEVSQGAARQLRATGIEAHFLIGGFEAWRALGLPLASKPVD